MQGLQKPEEVLDPPGVEFQFVVNAHHVGSGNGTHILWRPASALNPEAIASAWFYFCFFMNVIINLFANTLIKTWVFLCFSFSSEFICA